MATTILPIAGGACRGGLRRLPRGRGDNGGGGDRLGNRAVVWGKRRLEGGSKRCVCFFFLLGVGLYETSILNLGIIRGLFGHALVSALCGAAVGALLGMIAGAIASRSEPRPAVPDWARLNRDGFLVAIKMPPGLAEQAEEIARRLGAKEILL